MSKNDKLNARLLHNIESLYDFIASREVKLVCDHLPEEEDAIILADLLMIEEWRQAITTIMRKRKRGKAVDAIRALIAGGIIELYEKYDVIDE